MPDRRRKEYATMPQFGRSGEDRRKLSELRTLTDQVKTVEAMSDDEWQAQWMRSKDMQWLPKDVWLAYLKERIVILSRIFLEKKDAA